MQYDDKNTFVLFPHEKTGDNQPDRKGSLTDSNGKKWDIAVWERTSKKGAPFLSGKISEPYVKPEGKVWEQTRDKYKKQDVVLDDISDEPIDLSEVPF
jgi:hypothetical protein